MKTTGCKGTDHEIRYLEHVQAKISLTFKPRGNLRITLVSPAGTPTNLLLPRVRDMEESSFNNWPFLSVHFWGEHPSGTWKLYIQNEGSRATRWPGTLLNWNLVFYGTLERPLSLDYIANASAHDHFLGRKSASRSQRRRKLKWHLRTTNALWCF